LRQLSNYIENIREEERLHISREIHDELGQQLTVLKMDISRLAKKITDTNENLLPDINQIFDSINDMVKVVRKISSELRPGLLDDLGLLPALDWYSNDFGKRTGIKTNFISNLAEEKIPQKISIGLFRIFQESLTNVARHSQASRVDISLTRQDNQLVLLIEDNGKGFEPSQIQQKTLGIMGMKERAIMMNGTYTVNSIPGKGTIVEVIIPSDHIIAETI
jgi:signal transduction histidine kinase